MEFCLNLEAPAYRDVPRSANLRKMRCFALFLRILRKTKQRRAIWNRAKTAQNEQILYFARKTAQNFCTDFARFVQNSVKFLHGFARFVQNSAKFLHGFCAFCAKQHKIFARISRILCKTAQIFCTFLRVMCKTAQNFCEDFGNLSYGNPSEEITFSNKVYQ